MITARRRIGPADQGSRIESKDDLPGAGRLFASEQYADMFVGSGSALRAM